MEFGIRKCFLEVWSNLTSMKREYQHILLFFFRTAMEKKGKKKGGAMKFKNRKFKGGKQSGLDKMKAKTLGKKRR